MDNHNYFLGVDIGGTKSHALIADETGAALGFGQGGPGNWEGVGYDGFTQTLKEITLQALNMAGIAINQLTGAGMGIGGFDWPFQRHLHLEAIRRAGLTCPVEIGNDASIGILAGSEQGWGISVVAGTGSNCRGWSKDHKREGRGIGGAGEWSGEPQGGYGLVMRAMQAVSFEWNCRGPKTALTQAFIEHFGAKDIADLVEGVYLGRYYFHSMDALLVFQVAAQGDEAALEAIRWEGAGLGDMANGAIRQLGIQDEAFDVVLIGSLWDGHPLMTESLLATVHQLAPRARAVRLDVPPVVGGTLLGMEAAGHPYDQSVRARLIETTRRILAAFDKAQP